MAHRRCKRTDGGFPPDRTAGCKGREGISQQGDRACTFYRPVTIVTDKAHSYRRVIREINHRYDPNFDGIHYIDRKWRNNLIESDHAAMKRLLGYRQSFRTLRSAKATLSGIETIRSIKRGHIHHKQPGVQGEIAFIADLFEAAA